jgi:predicted phage tail protein
VSESTDQAAVLPVPALREVRLYGHLRQRFGAVYRFDVGTPAEALQALRATLPGWREHVLQRGGAYRIFLGRRGGEAVGEEALHVPRSKREAICIVPVVGGAKSADAQIITGAALVAVGVFTQQPWLVQLGAAQALGGISRRLEGGAGGPAGSREGADRRSTFGAPVNVETQGGAVPLAYGRCIVGSLVVSFGITSDSDLSMTNPGASIGEPMHDTDPIYQLS